MKHLRPALLALLATLAACRGGACRPDPGEPVPVSAPPQADPAIGAGPVDGGAPGAP